MEFDTNVTNGGEVKDTNVTNLSELALIIAMSR